MPYKFKNRYPKSDSDCAAKSTGCWTGNTFTSIEQGKRPWWSWRIDFVVMEMKLGKKMLLMFMHRHICKLGFNHLRQFWIYLWNIAFIIDTSSKAVCKIYRSETWGTCEQYFYLPKVYLAFHESQVGRFSFPLTITMLSIIF